MKPDYGLFINVSQDIYSKFSSTKFWNNYKPTPEDFYLSMARLVIRGSKSIPKVKEEVFGKK